MFAMVFSSRPLGPWSCLGVVALSLASAACTSTTTLPPEAAGGLRDPVAVDGTLELRASNGEHAFVHAGDSVLLTRSDGRSMRAKGKDLCRNREGVVIRMQDAPCQAGVPFARWEELASIEVKQFDGAGTVGLVTVGAAALVALAAAGGAFNDRKSSGKSGSTDGSTGSSSPISSTPDPGGNRAAGPSPVPAGGDRVPATPTPGDRVSATPSVVGSGGTGSGTSGGVPVTAPVRAPAGSGGLDTAPPIVAGAGGGAPIGDTRPPRVAGGGYRGSSTTTFIGVFPSGGGSEPSSHDEPSTIGPTTSFAPAQLATRDAAPIFSERDERRSSVRPLLRGDVGLCLFSATECTQGSARAGAIFLNIVELTGGVRFERGTEAPIWVVAALGLHGAFPKFPRAALYVGAQGGVALQGGLLFTPAAGLRIRTFGNLWLGAMPASFTYYSRPGRTAYSPSLELMYDF
jgi:hypothetical protein